MKLVIKRIGLILLLAIFMLSLLSCSREETPVWQDPSQESPLENAEKKAMKVAALNGPTGMGMVKLMQDNDAGEAALNYEFTLLSSPDDLAGKVINGEVDAAAVPTNLALLLYNRTEGQIQLAAVNTLGVLYVLENGDSIRSIGDLKGRTVNVSGKGATPDYVLRYLLEKNHLEADRDVMIDFKLQHSELAAALAAGDVDIALLPQPHVTTAMMNNENIRIALDITEEWRNASDHEGELAMGALIVQREFAERNKEAFNTFLEEYERSVAFVNEHIDAAAELIAGYGILPNVAIAKRSIPYSNIVYLDAQEAKIDLEDLYQILFRFEPKSIGGKLGDDEFYYKK